MSSRSLLTRSRKIIKNTNVFLMDSVNELRGDKGGVSSHNRTTYNQYEAN